MMERRYSVVDCLILLCKYKKDRMSDVYSHPAFDLHCCLPHNYRSIGKYL